MCTGNRTGGSNPPLSATNVQRRESRRTGPGHGKSGPGPGPGAGPGSAGAIAGRHLGARDLLALRVAVDDAGRHARLQEGIAAARRDQDLLEPRAPLLERLPRLVGDAEAVDQQAREGDDLLQRDAVPRLARLAVEPVG